MARPGKGPEGKADCAASIGGIYPVFSPPVFHPQNEAGARNVLRGEISGHPAPAKEG